MRSKLRTLATSFQSCVFMITCGMSAPQNRAAVALLASPADTLLNADEIVCCRPACCDATSAEAAMWRERCCLALLYFSACLLRAQQRREQLRHFCGHRDAAALGHQCLLTFAVLAT